MLSFDLSKGKVRFSIKCEGQFGNYTQSPTIGFINTHGLFQNALNSSIGRTRILFIFSKHNFFLKSCFLDITKRTYYTMVSKSVFWVGKTETNKHLVTKSISKKINIKVLAT